MMAAALLLSAVVASALLLVAPGAEASFDAPKRLVALLGIAAAAAVGWGVAWRPPAPAPPSRMARIVVWLALAAFAGAALSAATSPRPAVALDTLRVMLLGALCLPLGASPALADGRSRLPLAGFLGAATVDAIVSLLQAAGVFQPFDFAAVSGRTATSAFIGNEGQLALVLALGVIAAGGLAAVARRTSTRVLAAAAAVVQLVALLANRNLTSLLVLAASAAILLVALRGRRAALALVGIVAALAVAVVAVPPLRARVATAIEQARAGRWDDLTSNRLGAWAASLEMIAARPLLGIGPGTFGAEFVPRRLDAELRWRSRFVIPLETSTFSEAHCDYLQALAELGVPAGLAAIGAAMVLLVALAGRAGPGSPEAAMLLAILGGGAVAALTWFPLQRPATAVPLLLAAGRAWRLIA